MTTVTTDQQLLTLKARDLAPNCCVARRAAAIELSEEDEEDEEDESLFYSHGYTGTRTFPCPIFG